MIRAENILIVGGTGRNSGKTSLVTSLISRFRDIQPVGLKISPHFHKPSEGLEILIENKDYKIYRELSLTGDKDSSKMLIAGALEAYYIQVNDDKVGEAFSDLLDLIKPVRPIICESPALRQYIEPGVFFIADSDKIKNKKDLGWIYDKADLVVQFGDKPLDLDINYSDGRWFIT